MKTSKSTPDATNKPKTCRAELYKFIYSSMSAVYAKVKRDQFDRLLSSDPLPGVSYLKSRENEPFIFDGHKVAIEFLSDSILLMEVDDVLGIVFDKNGNVTRTYWKE